MTVGQEKGLPPLGLYSLGNTSDVLPMMSPVDETSWSNADSPTLDVSTSQILDVCFDRRSDTSDSFRYSVCSLSTPSLNKPLAVNGIQLSTTRPVAEQLAEMLRIAKDKTAAADYHNALSLTKFVLNNTFRIDSSDVRKSIGQKALVLLRKLATYDADAQFLLAVILENGVNGCRKDTFKPNYKLVFAAYLSACKRDHMEAAFRVAVMCEAGRGVTASPSKALQYYKKAAVRHHPGAMHRLGLCMIHAELGHPKCIRDGVKWLRMSCRFATTAYPAGLYDYAELHMTGISNVVFRDDMYVVELLRNGAKLGESRCIFKLAEAYEHGLFGLQQDARKSFEGYHRAAKLGHPESMFELSGWLLTGCNELIDANFRIQTDERKAFYWMSQSAKAGHSKAIYGMGYFIERGIGTQMDPQLALEWYSKAADAGNEEAVDKIALLTARHPTLVGQRRGTIFSANKSTSSLPPPKRRMSFVPLQLPVGTVMEGSWSVADLSTFANQSARPSPSIPLQKRLSLSLSNIPSLLKTSSSETLCKDQPSKTSTSISSKETMVSPTESINDDGDSPRLTKRPSSSKNSHGTREDASSGGGANNSFDDSTVVDSNDGNTISDDKSAMNDDLTRIKLSRMSFLRKRGIQIKKSNRHSNCAVQ